MSERDVFEQRLEEAVREFVETAPKEVDAARLTHSLATSVPRVRRLVARPAMRWPGLGVAWIPIAAILVAALATGLVATGALRDVLQAPAQPTANLPLESPPTVIASPVLTTPAPSAGSSPSPSPEPTVSPAPDATGGALLNLTMTSLMVISDTEPNSGTFDALGEAAASGLICRHGTVVDLVEIDRAAFASGKLLDFTIPKEFTCDDGSGTFVVDVAIHIDRTTRSESFTWRVLRGTGVYGRLQGAGGGTTLDSGPGQVVNTYAGSLVD
jgi:hypothetical protein